MRRIGNRNDWWDWGVILLLVAAGTIFVWAGVWVAHSRAGAPHGTIVAGPVAPASAARQGRAGLEP